MRQALDLANRQNERLAIEGENYLQALINRKLSRDDLLPFEKIAPTATMALATLHAQGYAIFR